MPSLFVFLFCLYHPISCTHETQNGSFVGQVVRATTNILFFRGQGSLRGQSQEPLLLFLKCWVSLCEGMSAVSGIHERLSARAQPPRVHPTSSCQPVASQSPPGLQQEVLGLTVTCEGRRLCLSASSSSARATAKGFASPEQLSKKV